MTIKTKAAPVAAREDPWDAARDRATEVNETARDPVTEAVIASAVLTALAEAPLAERERIAAYLDSLAENYPIEVFPPGSDSRDAIGGTAMRHAYRNAARAVREDLGDE